MVTTGLLLVLIWVMLFSIEDDNPMSPSNLYKSIHYKEEIGIFLYNSVLLIFKRFNGTNFEKNNHTVFNLTGGNSTLTSYKNYTDIYKLNENRLFYVQHFNNRDDENYTCCFNKYLRNRKDSN